MKRLIAASAAIAAVVACAPSSALAQETHRMCTSDTVNGGRVCANVHWTRHSDRYAKRLVRSTGLPVSGEVTYVGFTYRDIEDGITRFSIRKGHHFYLYTVRDAS